MSNTTTTAAPVSTTPSVPVSPTSTPTTSLPITSESSPSSSSVLPPSTSTSLVSQPTSTTVVNPVSTTPTVVATVSSTVVQSPTIDSSTSLNIVTVTSTEGPVTVTPGYTPTSSSSTSHSPTPSILGAGASSSANGSGLSSSGKIAIAVIIPIVVVALLFLLGVFLWRKRKARNAAEEERKAEMAEYGFNPNNDPNLVPVGAAYTDAGSDGDDGYRGWGTTSSNPQKPSTTLGSNSRAPNGMTYSDTTSQPGNYGYQGSPNGLAGENWSGDPLIGSGHPEGIDGITALGAAGAGAGAGGAAAAAASRNNNNRLSQAAGVQRGPSNASSSYSHNPPHSEASSDLPGGIGNYYQEEVPYNIYNDVAPAHGPYGDGTYGAPGAEQPVIRDVQARRNTKIERVPTFPQTQGGIAQNF